MLKNIAVAVGIALAMGASSYVEAKEMQLVVWQHPTSQAVKVWYGCAIDQTGNQITAVCDGAENEPPPDTTPNNPNPTVKLLDITTPYHGDSYRGTCKMDGEDWWSYYLRCDDTIFKSGFGKKHEVKAPT